MKRIIKKSCIAVLLVLTLLLSACDMSFFIEEVPIDGDDGGGNTVKPVGKDIPADTVDVLTEQWKMCELAFVSETPIEASDALYLVMDAVFTNRETGTKLTVPAFYDGDNTFKVRFAPTEYGIWDYETSCEKDASLSGKKGTVGANGYKGTLELYKHGFVKTNGSKYFVYDDGTPFFYLGDTHWTMYAEEFDSPGAFAGDTGAESHFKYIVDKRVEQGYTVYQSEPIQAPFDLSVGKFSERTVEGFKKADKYYAYIAEKGMVHANAEFFFASSLDDFMVKKTAYLEAISRYWVARFGAYPVMWTLAQEIDNDFYAENKSNATISWNYSNNPWVEVAAYIHKYDAYAHPLTGHQEGSSNTTVTGKGLEGYNVAGQDFSKVSNKGISVFLGDEVTARTGHDWFGAQWKQNVDILPNFVSARDYWESGKVAVNYEDRYVNLWTDDYGARVRGWVTMLNGFAGYAYGCIDLWYYNSTYDMEKDTVRQDGRSTITVKDKQKKWSEAIEFESGYQCAYMKKFLEGLDWWKLVPDFDSKEHFIGVEGVNNGFGKMVGGTLYSCAAIADDVMIIYAYNENTNFGTVCGLEKTEYTLQWFDPRSGKFSGEKEEIKPTQKDGNGKYSYNVKQKPDKADWVLLITKNK